MANNDSPIDAFLDYFSPPEPSEHLSIETQHAYLMRVLSPDLLTTTEHHLRDCQQCRAEVAATQQSIATIAKDSSLKDRLWSRIASGIEAVEAAPSASSPGTLAHLQQSIGALTQRTGKDAARMLEQGFIDLCAALLSALGAAPAHAASRGGSPSTRSADSSEGTSPTSADPFTALREAIAHAFASETLNSTFPGQEYDLQIRRLPGQPPVLRARPPGKNWQLFALIASDGTGQETRLHSTGDSLPLTQLAGLPGHFTTLSISFV